MILMMSFGRCTYQVMQTVPEQEQHKTHPRAVRLFVDALDYELNKNYPAALLMYQEALLYDSSSATIYFNIAKNYLRLGKDESAVLALKHCIDLDADYMDAWDMLASIYAGQGWWDLVEKTYVSMIARDSTDIDILKKLAVVYLRLGKKEEAAGLYEDVIRRQPVQDPKILIALGEVYFELNQYDDARRVFQNLIDSNPDLGFGYFGMGITCEAQQDTAGAIQYYREAIAVTPGLDEARDRLGRMLIMKEEWSEAIRLYSEAIQTDTTDLKSWLELGDLYLQTGDSLQAAGVYGQIQNRFPEEWQAQFSYGRYRMRQNDEEAALKAFDRVISLSPDNALGYLFSGIIFSHLDSIKQAEHNLTKALSIKSDDPLANYYLGTVYVQLKRYKEAAPLLQRALDIRPRWISALSVLANTYESLHMYVEADSLFKAALQIDPENALLLNNYSYSLSVRGERLEEALVMAARALEKDPENGAYLDTVGWIHYKLGNLEEALKYIRMAVQLRNDSSEVFDHLGDVYAALNMQMKAREAWEQALALDAANTEIQKKLERIEE